MTAYNIKYHLKDINEQLESLEYPEDHFGNEYTPESIENLVERAEDNDITVPPRVLLLKGAINEHIINFDKVLQSDRYFKNRFGVLVRAMANRKVQYGGATEYDSEVLYHFKSDDDDDITLEISEDITASDPTSIDTSDPELLSDLDDESTSDIDTTYIDTSSEDDEDTQTTTMLASSAMTDLRDESSDWDSDATFTEDSFDSDATLDSGDSVLETSLDLSDIPTDSNM